MPCITDALPSSAHPIGTEIANPKSRIGTKQPVFIGDTIRVEIAVADRRETKKSDRGIVTFMHRVLNQDDEAVMEYRIQRMIKREVLP